LNKCSISGRLQFTEASVSNLSIFNLKNNLFILVPKTVYHVSLGRTDFKETWDLQKQILAAKQARALPDVLITNEHYPVYTLGKTGDKDHLLLSDEELTIKGISYYPIDRGGDLTYHGPGQIVAYPIFDLNNYYKDTHRFLRDLEETVILTLKEYGIESGRDEQFTGVWVGEEKICAIGIKVSRWITMHGLAFNVNTDLDYFNSIIPCGIFHKGVTSMEKILGSKQDMNQVTAKLVQNFMKVFGNPEIREIEPDNFSAEFLSASPAETK
jgi:lipoyl(octanoyl) transferase